MVLTLDTPSAAAAAAPRPCLPPASLRSPVSAARACAPPRPPPACREKQLRMRAAQLWGWMYVRGVADFDAMTNIAKELRAALGRALHLARPEIVTEQVSCDGTRKWLLRLPSHGARRARARDRDRLHPRRRARHAVHFQPGRLHADLHVLPYRHAAPGAQSHRRRDRRADPAGARPPRRMAGRARRRGERAPAPRPSARSPTSC